MKWRAPFLSNAMPAPAIARLRPADGFRLIPVTYSKQFHEDLLSGDDLARRLSEPDPEGPKHRHHRLRLDDHRLQLAEGQRPASPHRAVRRQFFTKFNEFQKPPRHPKWREVNLAAQVPGWKRFDAAEEWLARNRAQQQAVGSQQDFDRFLAASPPRPVQPR